MRSLSIAFYNVQSLLARFDDFRSFLHNNDFDIVGLCETWLADGVPARLVNIPGYNFIRKDRGSRGGGIGFFIRDSLGYEILHGGITSCLEQMWIKIGINGKSVIICVMYRPPSGSFSEFFSSFEDLVLRYHPSSSDIVIGGDVNVDFLRVDDFRVRRLSELFVQFNLAQIIDSATRITNRSATLIDIILTSSESEDLIHGVDTVGQLSDHSLVYVRLNFDRKVLENRTLKSRSLRRVDRDVLDQLFSVTPFDSLLYVEDVNLKEATFTKLLCDLYDHIAPEKLITINNKCKPWFTEAIRLMKRQKDKAYKKFRRTSSPQDWQFYKQMRNATTNAINAEKRSYLSCSTIKSGMKHVWRQLNEVGVYSKKTSSAALPEALNDPTSINNFFLQFQRLGTPDRDLLNFYSTMPLRLVEEELTFTLVGEEEVISIISSMKSNAVGSDRVSMEMIKLCCPRVVPFLLNIFNSCLLKSVFPDSWKIARVMPLPKKTEIHNLNDLRPVAILPTCSKIFEKIIASQIRAHLEKYNILPQRQSGFRKGYSCGTTLLDVVDEILRAIDSGKTCILVLLDYSKAFDQIDHVLLLAILGHIGFAPSAVELIRSYLIGRTQYVETDKGSSTPEPVHCGVPQGSVLGPLLFCIYTFFLTNGLKYCIDFRYADDTQILHTFLSSEVESACEKVNDDLRALACFSRRHHLNLNSSKTKMIVFGRHKEQVQSRLSIVLDDVKLTCVSSARNLGLLMDSELRFKEHVIMCIQRAYANLKRLYPHRHYLTTKLKILLTESLVLSHFNFCDAVYGPCLTREYSKKIQKVQRSCLRFIYGIRKFEPVIHKLKDCNWIDMEKRRRLHSMILFHSIILYKTPPYLFNKIKLRSDVHTLNLRHRGLLSAPTHSTTTFTRSFTFNIVSLYNGLPLPLKSLSLYKFKKSYTQFLLTGSL